MAELNLTADLFFTFYRIFAVFDFWFSTPELIKPVFRSAKILNVIYKKSEHIYWLSKSPHKSIKGYQLADCHLIFHNEPASEKNQNYRKNTTKGFNPWSILYADICIFYRNPTVFFILFIKAGNLMTFAYKGFYNTVSFYIFTNAGIQNCKLITNCKVSRSYMNFKLSDKNKNRRRNHHKGQSQLPANKGKCNDRENINQRIFKNLIESPGNKVAHLIQIGSKQSHNIAGNRSIIPGKIQSLNMGIEIFTHLKNYVLWAVFKNYLIAVTENCLYNSCTNHHKNQFKKKLVLSANNNTVNDISRNKGIYHIKGSNHYAQGKACKHQNTVTTNIRPDPWKRSIFLHKTSQIFHNKFSISAYKRL